MAANIISMLLAEFTVTMFCLTTSLLTSLFRNLLKDYKAIRSSCNQSRTKSGQDEVSAIDKCLIVALPFLS